MKYVLEMKIIHSIVIVVLIIKSAGGNTTENDYKRWMDRFHSESAQAFLRSLEFLPIDKTQQSYREYTKKDEVTPNYDSIIKTDVQNFPSTEQTKKMMFALFGDRGLFMKDNFQRSGEIHIEGTALITTWKTFQNKSNVFEELQSSKNASIGSSVFSVLTQMLFLPKDVSKLETWLNQGIDINDEENNIACGPKVVINYKCCQTTEEPTLAPEFGSIEMGIG